MKNIKIFALMVFLITIGMAIGWMLININMTNKKIDILQVEREKFTGRWVSSDGDEEYYFFPDGTLTVNETTHHFGMGVSSQGYIIYNGTWEIIEVSDINGSSNFEFYTNYTRIEKHGMGEGMIFGSAIVPNQYLYTFKELDGFLFVYFILPALFGSNYTVKLEKIKTHLKCEPIVVVTGINYSSNPEDVPYYEAHKRFKENYTGSNLSIELRNAIIQNMIKQAELLGETSSILYEAIKITYVDWEERPIMIPCYAEKAVYNDEPVWIIAFNRCNGFEDGIGHFEIFYISIPTLELQFYGGCNSSPVVHWSGCD